MIAITTRAFWDAETAADKRRYRYNEKRVRKEVENQLRKHLENVKNGTERRRDVKAVVAVGGMLFPKKYEKALNKRGFTVQPEEEASGEKSSRKFSVVIKGFENPFAPDM